MGISHQREFYSALCPEVWSVVDGRVAVSGSEWMDAAEKARKKAEKEAAKTKSLTEEDKFDAFGNKIEVKKSKKQVAALRKQGQEVYTDDEVEKAGYTLDYTCCPLPLRRLRSCRGALQSRHSVES